MKVSAKQKRKKRVGRKGSYMVEASMTLPVFILAIVALSLLIQIISACEMIGHITAQEVREADLKASYSIQAVSLCNRMEADMRSQCEKVSDFHVKNVRYLFQKDHIYDLIGVTTKTHFTVKNPVGFFGEIEFTQKLLSRGFTGAVQDAAPLEAAAFHQDGSSGSVIVFPKYGERYHASSCSVVCHEKERGNEGRTMSGEDAKRKGYTACQLCHGGM